MIESHGKINSHLGFSLHPIMDAMWDWGEAYKKKLAQEEDAAANA